MKVLILAAEYPHQDKDRDGIFIKDQAMALNRYGMKADVVFVEPRSVKTMSFKGFKESHFQFVEDIEDGVFTFRCKGWNPFMNILNGGLVYATLTSWAVDRYIKKFGKPDLIHAHNTYWTGVSANQISSKYNIPYLLTEHSSRFLLKSITEPMMPWGKKVIEGAEVAMGVSSDVCIELKKYGAKKTSVVSNVVDTNYFEPPQLERKRDPFTFICIGNMTKNKAFDVLVRAFEKYPNKEDVRLVFAGEGTEQNNIKELTRELGLDEYVNFLGRVGRSDVRNAIWSANALILPSYKETFGVVLIEALSTGIPVIASKCGGPEDIVKENIGYLFDPGDHAELTKLMIKLRNKDWDSKTLRDHAVTHYSERSLVARLSEEYKMIVKKG